MSLEELREKATPFINLDNSQPEYQQDSNEIKDRIIEEIQAGEYDKTVYYYGISEQVDYSFLTDRKRVCISKSDNCVYPQRYTNELIYIAKQKAIHWFVIIKEDETTN
jgi:hypothetical protein